jgi:AraC-like DNA-binding protein
MAAFFNILILLGTLQGFIISGLLFFTKPKKVPYRLLAGFIILISLSCFNIYGSANDWFGSPLLRVVFYFIPLVVVMPLGPLLYFYVQASLNPEFKVTKKERPHFYSIIIDLVPSLTTIVFFIGVNTKLLANNPAPWGLFLDTYNVYADIPRWLSLAIYSRISYKCLKQYKTTHTSGLNILSVNLKWLQQLVIAMGVFVAVWLVYLIPYIIPGYSTSLLNTLNWYPIYLPLVILIYWLGVKAFMEQSVAKQKSATFSNTLSKETIETTMAVLIKTMETDKMFLKPELSLSLLSDGVNIPQKTISAVLNQHMHKNFNEFVNDYRLQAFKEKLSQTDLQHLTIAGIAAECGFNSQATFQRIFKEAEGISPSVYVKKIQNTE